MKTLKELNFELEMLNLFMNQVDVMKDPRTKYLATKHLIAEREIILTEIETLVNQKSESLFQGLLKKIGLRK